MVEDIDSVSVVGVVGSGVMGRGIVQVAAQAGYRVRVYDANPAAAQAARDFVGSMLRRSAEKGAMTVAEAEAALDRIIIADGLAAFSDVDLVIEAAAENLDIKRSLFAELETIVRDDALLTTNTSSLLVTEVAAKCRLPQRVAGLHFFNPVPLMKVVEIIGGERTEEKVIDTLMAVSKRFGHRAVRCIDSPGFLINHAGRGLYTEGLRVVQEGITDPITVDRIMRDAAGFRMGTFELFDLTGLDVSFNVTGLIYNQFNQEPRLRPTPMPVRRVAAGLYGRKVGEGFYRYEDGRQIVPEEAPAPDVAVPPIWISSAEGELATAVRVILAASGAAMDTGERPADDSLCIVTPLGKDATGAALEEGLDPRRTVAVDGLFLGRVTVMLTAVTDGAIRDAAHLAFARAGRPVSVVNDSVGFVAQRIVATIVNIACDIAQQRIAAPTDVDTFVKLGLGYPKGPLSLGEAMGTRNTLKVLEGMLGFYGDPRYRPSPWLKRRAALGVSLVTEEAALA